MGLPGSTTGACVKAGWRRQSDRSAPRRSSSIMACVRVVAFLVAAALAEQAPEVHVGPPAPACTIETCSG